MAPKQVSLRSMLSGTGLEVVKEVAKRPVGRPRKAVEVQDKDLGDLAAEVEVFRKKTRYEEKLEEQIKDLAEGARYQRVEALGDTEDEGMSTRTIAEAP